MSARATPDHAAPSGAGPTIRRAVPEDAAAYSALARQLAIDTFAQQNDPGDFAIYLRDTYGVERQRAEIADGGSRVLLAEVDGALAGYAYLKRGPAPEGVAGEAPVEIARFYVDGRWHGRGVAQALMRAAAEEARAWGGRTVWLGVWERNPRAIAFYAKCGFADVGSHLFLVGTDAQTDRLMAAPADVVAARTAPASPAAAAGQSR
jgi:GNAT superfamily N-acetyltransferase